MLQPRSIQSSLNIRDKILSLDYVLVISVLLLGIISMFAMYSTDGGEFKYHTNSHILRFFVFFGMFFVVSFISIRFWHETSYLFYIGVFILLLGVKYFGLTSSGSKITSPNGIIVDPGSPVSTGLICKVTGILSSFD